MTPTIIRQIYGRALGKGGHKPASQIVQRTKKKPGQCAIRHTAYSGCVPTPSPPPHILSYTRARRCAFVISVLSTGKLLLQTEACTCNYLLRAREAGLELLFFQSPFFCPYVRYLDQHEFPWTFLFQDAPSLLFRHLDPRQSLVR